MRKSGTYSSVVLTDSLQKYIDDISGYLEHNEAEFHDFTSLCDIKCVQDNKIISFAGVRRLRDLLTKFNNGKPTPYLHEMLSGSELHLPSPQQTDRNPELEKRLDQLRMKEESRAYKAMTRNVTSTMTEEPNQSIRRDLKMLNRQLTHMFNFVVTVGAAFAFGYKGSEVFFGTTDMANRMFSGLAVATCVFFADLYFIIRGLD